jgi:tetratricopeptide (TPR) repeat protein
MKNGIKKEESQTEFIKRKRKEIKSELKVYLKEVDHLLTADNIIDEVLHDDNDEDFESFVFLLAQDNMMSDPETAQEMAMDLFNYFPRKTLKGKSLAEIMPFVELKRMEKAFQNFKNGTGGGNYSYTLPEDVKNFRMAMKVVDKDDYYYDAMEAMDMGDYKMAKSLLHSALDIDPDYVQTYVGFVNLYASLKKKDKADENIKIAFEKTIKKFPKWPKEMFWGVLENRAYMRAIQFRADLYWDSGEKEKAIELFRILLKLNPNDNQGVRYEIAGLYAGINGEEVNKMTDRGNEKQDWSEQEDMVKEQNKKYKFWKEPKNL